MNIGFLTEEDLKPYLKGYNYIITNDKIHILRNNNISYVCLCDNFVPDGYYVYDLFVKQEYRGVGYGSSLMRICENITCLAGKSKLYLDVIRGSKNYDWYRNMNYLVEHKLVTSKPGCILMSKTFNNI